MSINYHSITIQCFSVFCHLRSIFHASCYIYNKSCNLLFSISLFSLISKFHIEELDFFGNSLISFPLHWLWCKFLQKNSLYIMTASWVSYQCSCNIEEGENHKRLWQMMEFNDLTSCSLQIWNDSTTVYLSFLHQSFQLRLRKKPWSW